MRSRLPTILLALVIFVPALVALFILFSVVYMLEEAVFSLDLEYRRFPFGLDLAIILGMLAAFLAAIVAGVLATMIRRGFYRGGLRQDRIMP